MMWPWSEIAKWKRLAEHHEFRAAHAQSRAEMFRAEYLTLSKAMRGAHKGIWRLRQRLKRYEQEQS